MTTACQINCISHDSISGFYCSVVEILSCHGHHQPAWFSKKATVLLWHHRNTLHSITLSVSVQNYGKISLLKCVKCCEKKPEGVEEISYKGYNYSGWKEIYVLPLQYRTKTAVPGSVNCSHIVPLHSQNTVWHDTLTGRSHSTTVSTQLQ